MARRVDFLWLRLILIFMGASSAALQAASLHWGNSAR